MPSPLIQNLFSALLDSPSIVVEVAAQTLEKAIPVIQSHFTFSGYEITKAYQDACRYSFVAISIGLDAPDSLIKKLRYPKVTREFARQINEFYFQEFAEKHDAIDVVSFVNSLKNFANKTELLFEINQISEEDLAALIGNRDKIEISDLILQQMQNVEPVDENLAAFLGFKNLLGDTVLFFFRELLRQDERIHRTQAALQQQRLCIDVQEIQTTLDDLKANQEKYPFLGEQISQQIQYLQQWQVQHQQMLAVQNRFAIKLEQMLDWVQDIKDDIAEINSKLDQILIAQQQTLSSKIEYLDGTQAYSSTNQQLVSNLLKQLPELSSQHPEYGQVTNKVARLLSSSGALNKAESLLQDLISTTKSKADKALAYFNLFQISWRKAFATSSSAEKEKIYAQALAALQNAIELDKPDQHYVLHDINTGYYPIEKLLGAGGMGCVFLCENHNTLNKDEYPKVVVKCFWQNISGDLQTVFKEPSAMHQLREYVPKPLGFGYADNRRQTQAYFVTEYIEGAIDGEVWLEKQGALDLNTGLQVALQIATALQYAHEQNIYHLDLKPSNLLLLKAKSKVSVKLIDFGIAEIHSQKSTVASSNSGLTSFGQAMFGTWEYASPEQRRGVINANSDIFAFGMTMYRLLTAKQPHPFMERQLPESLRELLCNCVENEPAERPKSGDLVKNFRAIIDKLKKEAQDKKEQEAKRQAELEAQRKKEQEAKRQAELEAQRKQEQEAKRKAELEAQRKKEQEAKRQAKLEAQPKQEQELKPEPTKLSILNPLDYLRLLWSVFVMPQTLENYDNKYDVAKWLISSLIFLPLLIPNFASGLGLLPSVTGDSYLWISLVLGVGWFVIGWFGDKDEDWIFLVDVPLGVVYLAVLAAGLEIGLAGGLAIGLAVGLAVGLAGGLAGCLVFGLAGGLAGGFAGGLVFIIVLLVVFIILVQLDYLDDWKSWVLLFTIPSIVAGIIVAYMDGSIWAGIIATITAIAIFVGVLFGISFIKETVEESIKNKTPSWIVRIAFFSLIIDYIFLIYYCFLGGWRLFV